MRIMAITISPRFTLPVLLIFSLQACLASTPAYCNPLIPHFYALTCPMAEQIVRSIVQKAVMNEPRMGASLLRLHFHDCFVQGCDASILLDDSGSIVSEKGSLPNNNSVRGFDVVDEIKSALEKECPQTVSCADILTIAARDSVVLGWAGKFYSTTASLSGSNNDLPAPNSTLQTLITKFQRKGLDLVDLVALSGSHTIGQAKCLLFKQRLYNQNGNGQKDVALDNSYYARLISACPRSGGDNNLSPLDYVSPARFDNNYFKNLLSGRGLLTSDQELFTSGTMGIVNVYAAYEESFLIQFAASMVKMGNIGPLTGSQGEIRVNCRRVLG